MRTKLDSAEISLALVDAAERLLPLYGVQRLTVRELAREAGVGVGTVYLHYTRKEDLFRAVLQRSMRRLLDHLWHASQVGDPAEALRAVLRERILWRFDEVAPSRCRVHPLSHDVEPFGADLAATLVGEEVILVRRLLDDGALQKRFRATAKDPATARTILLATDALLPQNLRPADFSDRDGVEARIEALSALLIQALLLPLPS